MDPNEVIEIFRRNVTEHYFDFKGRVSRKEFWYFMLACFVLYLGAAIVDAILGMRLLGAVVGLALLLPTAGMGIRRLQDIGRNGLLVWVAVGLSAAGLVIGLFAAASIFLAGVAAMLLFGSVAMLIWLADLIVTVVLVYFWIQPGTAGVNNYGPDPLAPAAK